MDVSETRDQRPPTLLMGLGQAPSLYVLLSALIGAGFIRWSTVDLWVTHHYWNATEGFFLGDSWWAVAVYEGVPIVTISVGALLVGFLVYDLVRREPQGIFTTRVTLFLLAGLAIGPGLVVNWLFKGHWGRPRPRDVVEFGGSMDFMPALVPGGACERNCSFVAGHPSSVFWLAAFGFLLAGRRRYAVFAAAGLAGFVAGWGRIVQGAHFLSDVVFSFVFTFATVYVLARWVFRIPPKYGATTVSVAALTLAAVSPALAWPQGPSTSAPSVVEEQAWRNDDRGPDSHPDASPGFVARRPRVEAGIGAAAPLMQDAAPFATAIPAPGFAPPEGSVPIQPPR